MSVKIDLIREVVASLVAIASSDLGLCGSFISNRRLPTFVGLCMW